MKKEEEVGQSSFCLQFKSKTPLKSCILWLNFVSDFAQVGESKVHCIGAVEDTRLEAMAKDTKKIQGQGQPFRGQTLSRPRTGMLEAKDQGHRRKCSRKKKDLQKFFQVISNS